jgi:hypothetical protein
MQLPHLKQALPCWHWLKFTTQKTVSLPALTPFCSTTKNNKLYHLRLQHEITILPLTITQKSLTSWELTCTETFTWQPEQALIIAIRAEDIHYQLKLFNQLIELKEIENSSDKSITFKITPRQYWPVENPFEYLDILSNHYASMTLIEIAPTQSITITKALTLNLPSIFEENSLPYKISANTAIACNQLTQLSEPIRIKRHQYIYPLRLSYDTAEQHNHSLVNNPKVTYTPWEALQTQGDIQCIPIDCHQPDLFDQLLQSATFFSLEANYTSLQCIEDNKRFSPKPAIKPSALQNLPSFNYIYAADDEALLQQFKHLLYIHLREPDELFIQLINSLVKINRQIEPAHLVKLEFTWVRSHPLQLLAELSFQQLFSQYRPINTEVKVTHVLQYR